MALFYANVDSFSILLSFKKAMRLMSHDKFCSFHWMSLNLSHLLNIHHSMPAFNDHSGFRRLVFLDWILCMILMDYFYDAFLSFSVKLWFEFSLFFLFFVNGLFYSFFIFLFYQLMIWMAIMKKYISFFFCSKEIYFIQQGCIKLIKSDIHNVTKDFHFK